MADIRKDAEHRSAMEELSEGSVPENREGDASLETPLDAFIEEGRPQTASAVAGSSFEPEAPRAEAGGGSGLPPAGGAGGSSLSGADCPPPSFGDAGKKKEAPRREYPAVPVSVPCGGQGRARAASGISDSQAAGDFLGRVWRLFWDTFHDRYWDFAGRANRTEFWVFFIGSLIISALLNILAGFPFIGWIAALASIAWWFATLIPTWSAAFRRLHDTGRSGWWIAGPLAAVFALLFIFPASLALSLFTIAAIGPVLLVAGVLFVVALVFCVLPGQKGLNAWGAEPESLDIF